MSSVECKAPQNCETFTDPVFKGDSLYKCIEVWQEGKCIYSREGALTIIHESQDKIIFRGASGQKTTIYNKNGVIIISYKEPDVID